jgi:Cytochrome P460
MRSWTSEPRKPGVALPEAGGPGWNIVMRTFYVPVAVGGVSVILAVAAIGQAPTPAPGGGSSVVDANGNLHVPDDYRATYQFLGAWAVASDRGPGSKELHVVYASPGTVAAYRTDGRFPDGATLVKEVFQTATAPMTTGTVSRADTLHGWFVMVKGASSRFPGNKLWGDGWGWSWFDAGNPSKTTSTDYRLNCLGCHVPAQASDWVYVGGYPPLKRTATQ